ncbi:MAG: PEP-CTERM sorting domain-containing protein [Ketobacteraceae bacterium]|nr:PEP-CTERM sorting domain-containing protein [Ketobacteraceae bacterium]
MFSKKTLISGAFAAAALLSTTAQAHLVSFGWTDNMDGTVTLWGEHWHGDQTSSFSDNGGITITDTSGTISPYTVQWNGVLNNRDRDDMLADGTLTGWDYAGNGLAEHRDWFYTDALVIGNGDWNFFTGTRCCVDTMSAPVTVTLTGITSVGAGTGPGDTSVPEPTSVALFGLGLIGMGIARRKKA